MTIAFLFCAGLIPLVPLFGVDIFRRRKDRVRKNVCWGLFALQLVLSILYALAWLRTH